MTAAQTRQLADIARRFSGDTSADDRRTEHRPALGLRKPICPISIANSRGSDWASRAPAPFWTSSPAPARTRANSESLLRAAWPAKFARGWPTGCSRSTKSVRNLHIKISGCFNSCGQHHIADLGFYGTSRTIANRKVPHFQVVLGGKWQDNAGAYGLAIGTVPSKNDSRRD